MFMDKQVFEDTGGFDEKYFMFGEDIDLSYKILKKGLKNYYYGDASIIHYKGESTSKNSKYYKNFYGAMGIYYRKYIAKNIFSKILSFLIRRQLELIQLKQLQSLERLLESSFLLLRIYMLKLPVFQN